MPVSVISASRRSDGPWRRLVMVMHGEPNEAWNGNVIAASQAPAFGATSVKEPNGTPLQSVAISPVVGARSNDRLWQIVLKKSMSRWAGTATKLALLQLGLR